MQYEFFFPSADGKTEIHAVEWVPTRRICAVVQICHGMVEYILRYAEFAEYLNQYGIYVTGHDHLGHGQSVNGTEDFGHFDEKHGNEYVIADIHSLRMQTVKKYPNVPYIMMGHSMGSFLLRQYLIRYSKGLSGAIIMGTGYQPAATLMAGRAVCRVIALLKGWRYHSKLVNNLGMGGYNKAYEPSQTHKDWITSDLERQMKYVRDPLCSFTFTVGGYDQMFAGMMTLTKEKNIEKINRVLPVLFVSGADDPVGECGVGVKKAAAEFEAVGMSDVTVKLYPGDRHEILNETDRDQVFKDLREWIESRL